MKNNLIWLDLEMTGLNPNQDHILEIAIIPTDNDLNILDDGLNIIINHPKSILDNMNDWCKKTHRDSGLVNKVNASKISNNEAEILSLNYIKKFIELKKSPICGNSIHMDRNFLAKHMPKLHDYFHYRNIDVSSLKEILNRWNITDTELFQKNSNHQALEDVKESIYELKFYREKGFINAKTNKQ